jgi:hypothetical protein
MKKTVGCIIAVTMFFGAVCAFSAGDNKTAVTAKTTVKKEQKKETEKKGILDSINTEDKTITLKLQNGKTFVFTVDNPNIVVGLLPVGEEIIVQFVEKNGKLIAKNIKSAVVKKAVRQTRGKKAGPLSVTVPAQAQ